MPLPSGVVVRPITAQYASLRGITNGNLPTSLLVAVPGGQFLHPVAARKFRALQLRALSAGLGISYSRGGCYRSYSAQVSLFLSRYQTANNGIPVTKFWNGQWWRKKSTRLATAASPGTSNHGWGRAIDTAIDPNPADGLGPDGVRGIGGAHLAWLGRNAADFGFAWELLPEEPWHIRDVTGDAIPQAVLDIETFLKLPPIGNMPPAPPLPPSVTFDPPTGKWGLYPVQSWRAKPGVLAGMRESDLRPYPNTGHIIYAQWAVKLLMGFPAMAVDGYWGTASAMYLAAAINNWNAYTGDKVPNNGGAIGLDQWRLIDAYVKGFKNLAP